jgi:hypothetical protein
MKKWYFAGLLILPIILVCCGGPNTEGKTYTIWYYGNGETGGFAPSEDSHFLSGQTAIVKDKHTLYKDGYKFLYWNTKPEGNGKEYHPGETITVVNINIHLYAIWEKLP